MSPLEMARERYEGALDEARDGATIRRMGHPGGALCVECAQIEHADDAAWLDALHAVSEAWADEYRRTGVVPRDPTRTLAQVEGGIAT